MRDVESALRAGDLAGAMRMSDDAVAQGFEHSNLLVLSAHHQLAVGYPQKAFELASRARASAPRSVDVLNVVGLSLVRLGRAREAVTAYDSALRVSPDATVVRFNRACAYEDLREPRRARAELERIVESQPGHAEALAHLANMAVQRGDTPGARALAGRALQSDPAQVAAHLTLAQADIQERKFAEAIARLKPLPIAGATPVNRSIAQGLLGDALDGLGRTAEAFAAYSASQATLREYFAPAFASQSVESAPNRVERLQKWFAPRPPAVKASRPAESGARTHVFLVGFPRSGTTLLEQALASHPHIETMEERDCLIEAVNDFIVPPDGLDRLAALTDGEASRYRDLYWQRTGLEGVKGTKPVFVDKMPLNSVILCLVAKIFPDAKILFALRDPRDVVLSCFRRRFVMTPQMFELTTLEGAATYYVAVMQLVDTCRRVLALDVCETRYEDLVREFDRELQKVCTFLGLGWNESMRRFAGRARAGMIDTPSAPQVARGLFTEGIGQWLRYREQLAPVLPILAPWVARFGYGAEG